MESPWPPSSTGDPLGQLFPVLRNLVTVGGRGSGLLPNGAWPIGGSPLGGVCANQLTAQYSQLVCLSVVSHPWS